MPKKTHQKGILKVVSHESAKFWNTIRAAEI